MQRIVLSVALILIPALLVAEDKKAFTFEDEVGTITFSLPVIGDDLKDSTNVHAPGITKEVRFTSEDGNAAVLVSTKIRTGLPKDDSVLERVEPKYRSFAPSFGKENVVLEFRGKKPGRVLEFALVNADYNEFYPIAVGGSSGPDEAASTIGLSLFFMESGRMFELCIFLKNPDELDRAKLKAKARGLADKWRASVKVEP